jgi:3-hydroxyacyl-CoA dehydrogenase
MPVPPILQTLVERGWIGEKAGQGFYKRAGSEILVLDPERLTYRSRQAVQLPILEAARNIVDPSERVKALFLDQGKVGRFLRLTLGPTLLHTAEVANEIAYSIDDVDRAMRWGYGWELGPFEIWDAVGVRDVVDAIPQQIPVAGLPPLVQQVVDAGANRFRKGEIPPASPGLQILKAATDLNRVVQHNAGASLVDLDGGVLAVEFHSKMNVIGGDTIEMLHRAVAEAASRNFTAIVVGNDAPHFSAGANLLLLLLEAQEGNWDDIELMIRRFQEATQALRYADVPVIVAPAGLTLGGGCEIALHAHRVQAAAESYIGLTETAVGLIPAAGGIKEMLARAMSEAPSSADPLPVVQKVFETIGYAKVSGSAREACRLGYLSNADGVSMNRERLIGDAKALAIERSGNHYQRPARRTVHVGGEGVLAALKLGIHLAWRAGRLSDHDAVIGRALALVLSGGTLPHAATVSEQHLLDLEREAFLKLCGEPKTLERIQYTLKTGKPLRN